MNRIVVCWLACVLLISPVLMAQDSAMRPPVPGSPGEDVDHKGMLEYWGPRGKKEMEMGKGIYNSMCFACHGVDGNKVINPQARPFASAPFANGADPYSIWKTLTYGYNQMPPQTWLTPQQRYAVIHYIREVFLKERNPSQYTEITPEYLDSLPKGTRRDFNSAIESKPRMFGPALASQLGRDISSVLTVDLGHDVAVSYNLHRMRLAGAWTGGHIDVSGTQHHKQRGEKMPMPAGPSLLGLDSYYWALGGDLDYDGEAMGIRNPAPRGQLDYKGHYLHGDRVVLSFDIDGRHVLESPEAEVDGERVILKHTLRVAPGDRILRLCVGDLGVNVAGAGSFTSPSGLSAGSYGRVGGVTVWTLSTLVGAGEGVNIDRDDRHRAVVTIEPATQERVFQIWRVAGEGESDRRASIAYGDKVKAAIQDPDITDPVTLMNGGPRRWSERLVTDGELGQPRGAYALDTINLPVDNPYNAWMRNSALDFFDDGRLLVTTHGGDAWIVSGIDDELKQVTWRRFATGLYEPFGVRIVDGQIYITCKDRIVRLQDLNGDGEADFYESFFADPDVSTFFHAFNFDLQTDSRGYFYYAKAGQYTSYAKPGAVIKVAPDGKSHEVFCTGFRTPNGMGWAPGDRFFVSDNQGSWMPASKISEVRKGGFYGYVPNKTRYPLWSPDGTEIDVKAVPVPEGFDRPMVWMPQELDNSSGGQLYVDDERFGPLSGKLLHTSYGKAWMYYTLMQDFGDVSQAAVARLPFEFDAGIMRARVNPTDGQVYTVGLSGWGGPRAGADGCLQRLRYAGVNEPMLTGWEVKPGGMELRFNAVIDGDSVLAPEAFVLEQWNYRWTENYGSEHYSVRDPERVGHDEVTISSVHLGDDGRSVFVSIPDIQPVDQMHMRLVLKTNDGGVIQQ
ncbi:MAG: DUF6797 domain-containing protein, partial [Planctomycetota bacterium]